MGKFCGKCGNKLDDNGVCLNCNAPITGEEPKKKMDPALKVLLIFGIIVLTILVILIVIVVRNAYKTSKYKTKYVEPYLKSNYPEDTFEVEYYSSGRCIVSGDCAFDPVMGCDGGSCVPYKYLEDKKCKSYYYSVKNSKGSYYVTVVDYKSEPYVVEGKGIYGDDSRRIEPSVTKPIPTTEPIIIYDYKYKTTEETTTNATNNE